MGRDGFKKIGYVRINSLFWADILVSFALFPMQDYLTDVWELEYTHAAGIMNVWGGISKVLPVFLLFFVDTLLGNFKMLVISSISHSAGMSLLVMSMPPVLSNATGTCKEYESECIGLTHKVLFYTGMALIAVGMAGYVVSIQPFREAQHDDSHTPRIFLRIAGSVLVVLVPMAGFFVFPYIQQWLLLFGVSLIYMVCATLFFLTGWNKYKVSGPAGSPLSDVCRVFVAAALKISQPFPLDTNHLYTNNDHGGNDSFPPSRFLRCLEKAAIILPDTSLEDQLRNGKWRLCSVEQVEAAKFVVRVIPIGATFIICTIVSSVGDTFLVEQAGQMNSKLGIWKVPSQILLLLFMAAKSLFNYLANHLIVKSRKCRPRLGIAVAMLLSVLCCVSAALIEIERLKVVKRHGLVNKPDEGVPMAIYWLAFPFFLLAGMDAFFRTSVVEFYKRESPKDMEPYCACFTDVVSGLGLMCSMVTVRVVGKISEIGGTQNWFQDSLNESRLDLYYWVMAGLSALNLLIFVPLAFRPTWKLVEEEVEDE